MSSSTHNAEHQQQHAADKPRCDAHTSFGTNSPPLETTGSARPMGMASVAGDVDAGHVSDREQRKAYFGGEEGPEADKLSENATRGMETERARERHAQGNKVGQSMAAQMDERT